MSVRELVLSCPFLTLRPVHFLSKNGNGAAFEGKMDGEVFISRQCRHFHFVEYIIKIFFPNLYLDMACKQLVSCQRKSKIGKTKVLLFRIADIFFIIS